MLELIHHTDESADGGVSPFDSTIRKIVADEDVLLASPYLTLDYLEGLVNDADSWRLLTDMEAWLDSCPASERETIREFVARHHERIRDVRNLHAKAVIGETGALVGSANLTRTGLGGRDELGVRFDEPERIAELREWFDELWNESSAAKLDAVDERIQTSSPVPSSASGSSATPIPSESRRISASISANKPVEPKSKTVESVDEGAHGRLVEQVQKAPSQRWIDDHFELLEELVSVTDVSVHDPTLFMSITKAGKVHTTINNRIVFGIQPFRGRTLFILSPDTNQIDRLITEAAYSERFEDRDKNTPYLLGFDDGTKRVADSSFRRGWMRAALSEVDRGWDESPYRKKYTHEPVVYRAAVDHDYRERVLNEAFGE